MSFLKMSTFYLYRHTRSMGCGVFSPLLSMDILLRWTPAVNARGGRELSLGRPVRASADVERAAHVVDGTDSEWLLGEVLVDPEMGKVKIIENLQRHEIDHRSRGKVSSQGIASLIAIFMAAELAA